MAHVFVGQPPAPAHSGAPWVSGRGAKPGWGEGVASLVSTSRKQMFGQEISLREWSAFRRQHFSELFPHGKPLNYLRKENIPPSVLSTLLWLIGEICLRSNETDFSTPAKSSLRACGSVFVHGHAYVYEWLCVCVQRVSHVCMCTCALVHHSRSQRHLKGEREGTSCWNMGLQGGCELVTGLSLAGSSHNRMPPGSSTMKREVKSFHVSTCPLLAEAESSGRHVTLSPNLCHPMPQGDPIARCWPMVPLHPPTQSIPSFWEVPILWHKESLTKKEMIWIWRFGARTLNSLSVSVLLCEMKITVSPAKNSVCM